MAAPQVGVYTTICLVVIKLVLIFSEALLYAYLSVQVNALQQLSVAYNQCLRQLERIEFKLEKLVELRGRLQGQPHGSEPITKTLNYDPGNDHQAPPTAVRPQRGCFGTCSSIRELAKRISTSLKQRCPNAASNRLDEGTNNLNTLSNMLSKVLSYIDRDLKTSGRHVYLDDKKIQDVREDVDRLYSELGPSGEMLVPYRPFLKRIEKERDIFALIFRASGIVMGFVAILLGGLTFIGARGVRLDEEHQCRVADADIIGDGVRAGTWSQSAMLFLTTFLGNFHHSHTAVKELGSGLIGMHVSLALAFIGPLAKGELSPVDAVLGSMVLDVQNSALSMQLMEKETLAARWQVGAVMAAQLLGLVTIGTLVHSFAQESLAADGCRCFSVFWWSWFSNCSTGHPNHAFPFWIYYSLRCLSSLHSWFLSVTKTTSYDKALKWEKKSSSRLCDLCRKQNSGNRRPSRCGCDDCMQSSNEEGDLHDDSGSDGNCITCGRLTCCRKRDVPCEPCPRCEQCENCNHVSFEFSKEYVKLGCWMHSELPTTVSQLYLEHGVFGWLSMAAAERTIATQSIRLTSPVYSIGQITPIVIAGLTILRVIWVSAKELSNQDRSKSELDGAQERLG